MAERAARGSRGRAGAERAAADAARLAVAEAWIVSEVDEWIVSHRAIDNRRHRLRPIVLERARLADSIQGRVEALGLKRRKPDPIDLGTYFEDRYGDGAREAKR